MHLFFTKMILGSLDETEIAEPCSIPYNTRQKYPDG